MKTKSLSILVFFSVIIFSFSSCMKTEPIELQEIDNVIIKSINDDTLKMELLLLVSNPNKLRFRVNEIDLQILAGDIELGRINDIEAFDLVPDSVQLCKIPVSVSLNNLETNAKGVTKALLRKGGKMRFKGYIEARSFIFSEKINIDKEKRINILKSIFG